MIIFVCFCPILYGIILALFKALNIKLNPKFIIFNALIYHFIQIQPQLLQQIVEVMACRKISDKKYILSDTNFQCQGTNYTIYTYYIILPLYLLFVIIIPTLIFLTLKPKKLDQKSLSMCKT